MSMNCAVKLNCKDFVQILWIFFTIFTGAVCGSRRVGKYNVNKANWEGLVYHNYCRMVHNCIRDAEGLIA